jgi:hypothetical protein
MNWKTGALATVSAGAEESANHPTDLERLQLFVVEESKMLYVRFALRRVISRTVRSFSLMSWAFFAAYIM